MIRSLQVTPTRIHRRWMNSPLASAGVGRGRGAGAGKRRWRQRGPLPLARSHRAACRVPRAGWQWQGRARTGGGREAPRGHEDLGGNGGASGRGVPGDENAIPEDEVAEVCIVSLSL